ncbi:MAG: hypothetical protein WD795_15210 [Woeseia sp.]
MDAGGRYPSRLFSLGELQHLEGGIDAEGKVSAWLHRTVFPSINSTFDAASDGPSNQELELGFVDNPFAVPSMRLETGKARGHVRIGSLRSVANVYHAFAAGSFADELAHLAGRDPKAFLLDLIGPDRLSIRPTTARSTAITDWVSTRIRSTRPD